ncbi:hypothetical protein LCGC14_2650450, partial [marine sediment metagenome]
QQRKVIRLWIDTSAAYPGTYAACGSGMIDIHSRTDVATGRWDTISEFGVYRPRGSVNVPAPRETLDRRCGGCHREAVPLHPQLLYNLTRPEKSMVLLAPLAKEAGGLGLCKHQLETANSNHPAGFLDTADADYRTILAFLGEASHALAKVKRFDMPQFRPAVEYLDQMKSYGILSSNFDPEKAPVDVYRLDEAYWRSLWHRPIVP